MGTTLEILQAYPLGTLEVEYKKTLHLEGTPVSITLSRAVVIGFTSDPLEREGRPVTQVGISLLTDRAKWLWVDADTLTPVLSDFSDLCKPLEDGSVPAVEVAKLAYRFPNDPFISRIFSPELIRIHAIKSEVAVFVASDISCIITSDYRVFWQDSTSTPANNQVAIIDYLRSKHFALPVNGKPLVEGVDYIRKA